MVRSKGLPDDMGRATGVVEMAFWVDPEARAMVIECGRVHSSQAVRRVAERVLGILR